MNVQEFQNKLKEIQSVARENENSLTTAQIRDTFAGLELDKSQLLGVLKYLTSQGIQIEGMEETAAEETIIEETKGKFPTWLAPVQVKVLPVSEKTLEYSEAITEKLVEAGIRVALDDDNQKIGYKIRAAQQVDRVPYMLVLGAKEAEAGNVSVRDRKGETTTMEVDEFIAKVTSEIKNRSL